METVKTLPPKSIIDYLLKAEDLVELPQELGEWLWKELIERDEEIKNYN